MRTDKVETGWVTGMETDDSKRKNQQARRGLQHKEISSDKLGGKNALALNGRLNKQISCKRESSGANPS